MQLRLSRFDGLRLSLDRGWYLVPSHMSEDEVRRLLDVLTSGLDGVQDVVELDWEDGEWLGPNFGAGTLAYLRVPETDARAQIEVVVAGWELRLGLLHLPDAVCWPDPAWDELEVKSALVGWFRREFARKEHPLARLGLTEFPLQQVAEVTAEPIELIELIEAALGQRGEDTALDWESCIDDSIGRRLSSRLEEDEIHAAELVELLVTNDDGHLRASMHPHATAALVKLGLATQASDDVLLGPLARCAGRDAVRRTLEASAAEWSVDELEWRPLRRLIDITASLAELGYAPGPELARALTADSAGPSRVFVVHQSGMGGSTIIREILAERAVHGDYAVFVDMSDSDMDSELADLLLIMFAKLLTRFAEAKFEIDRTAFDDLERGFTELRTRVIGDEGAMVGVPRSEQVSPRELRRFAQWSMSAQRSLSGKSWSRVRAELLAKVEKLLAMFGAALSTRQQRVVLVLEDFWMPSRATIDELVAMLEGLPVPLVFDWADVDGGLPTRANHRVVVHVPPLPLRGKSDGREVIRTQVLDVALELLASAGVSTESVADPEVLRELVRLSGGCIRQLRRLKYEAEEAGSGRLTIDDLHDAADGLAQDLISNLPLRTSDSAKLREIIQTRSLPLERLDRLLKFNRVFMYEGGAWVDLNPLLWRLPGFVKTFGPESGRPRGVLARMRDRVQVWLDLPF